MADPLLGEFEIPIMIDFPVGVAGVPHLDAVLDAHSDDDRHSVRPAPRRDR